MWVIDRDDNGISTQLMKVDGSGSVYRYELPQLHDMGIDGFTYTPRFLMIQFAETPESRKKISIFTNNNLVFTTIINTDNARAMLYPGYTMTLEEWNTKTITTHLDSLRFSFEQPQRSGCLPSLRSLLPCLRGKLNEQIYY